MSINNEAGKSALVIGGGIVGQCVARALRKSGLQVTLVERSDPTTSTAVGGCAILATTHVAPVSLPGMLRGASAAVDGPGPLVIRSKYIGDLLEFLVPFYTSGKTENAEAISRTLKEVNDRAIAAFDRLLGDGAGATSISRQGWLYVYKSEESLANAQSELVFRERRGTIMQRLTGDEAREMEPSLSDSVSHALYLPEAAHIVDPTSLLATLARENADAGVTMVRDEIVQLLCENGVASARSAQASYTADHIVLAAGPWSSDLLREVGVRIPHAPEIGYSITYPEAAVRLNLPVSSGDYKCVINSMAAGLRFTTGADLSSLEAETDFSQTERLKTAAEDLFKGDDLGDYTAWRGFRSLTPDSLPIIGRAPGIRNLLLAYGHGHLGITLAAVTAEMITDLASTPDRDSVLPALRASRFSSYV